MSGDVSEASTTEKNAEAKAESDKTSEAKETKSETSSETKQQVEKALDWEKPKEESTKDRSDSAYAIREPSSAVDDKDAKMHADWKEYEATKKEDEASWSDYMAKRKDADAADSKWQAEHAESKDDRDYYAARAADQQGEAAEHRKEGAEHKAERAELQSEAAAVRSDLAKDRTFEGSDLANAAAERKDDVDAWKHEAEKKSDEAWEKHRTASEIRAWGVEEVADTKKN